MENIFLMCISFEGRVKLISFCIYISVLMGFSSVICRCMTGWENVRSPRLLNYILGGKLFLRVPVVSLMVTYLLLGCP